MNVTPRPQDSRACYLNHWNQNRFEPLGKIFVVPPGERVLVRNDGEASYTSVICHLQPEAIKAGLEHDLQWSDHQFEASLDIQQRYIQSLLIRLAGETTHQRFGSEKFAEHLCAQLGIELARYFVRAESLKTRSGGLAPWRLRLIDERIAEVREPPSLAELAVLCKMSVRQLSRGFRTSRGSSIGDYIGKSLINHAKRLLIADGDIKATAYTLGFSSPASFGAAFRRATGSTPRMFKQRAPVSKEHV
ncbi:MAG: AraC family transcriptional regulator [Spongiibacteraceae bacterium]